MVEFEKQANHLTFHPKIGSSRPRVDNVNGSPANLQRNSTYNQLNSKKASLASGPIPSNKPQQKYNPYKKPAL